MNERSDSPTPRKPSLFDAVNRLHSATAPTQVKKAKAELRALAVADPTLLEERTTDGIAITPLHHAASLNNPAAVELLLKLGADPNAATANGERPLDYIFVIDPDISAERDETPEMVRVVELLLAHGANPDGGGDPGFTPYIRSVRYGYVHIPQMLAAVRPMRLDLNTAVQLGKLDEVRRQLAESPDLVRNAPNPRMVLWDALGPHPNLDVDAKHELVRLLLDHGAEVNQPDVSRISPLLKACSGGVPARVVQLLLDRGADVNALYEGETALDRALCGGNDEIVALLKRAGAKQASQLRRKR